MRGANSAIAALIFSLISSFASAEESPTAGLSFHGPEIPNPKLQPYGPFPLAPNFEGRVQFWVEIYSKVHSWESLLHDVKMPQISYVIVNTKAKTHNNIGAEKARILGLLKGLVPKQAQIERGALKLEQLLPEEKIIYASIAKAGMEKRISELANPARIRAQAGLRDNLVGALFASGRYLPRMERVFLNFGLPKEIAYLPFVESGFNKKAVSKVGASGIWQFMPYTGKLYLRVDSEVDERNDPMRAAEAAARLMKQNYEMLGEWTLAITAYNHGAVGIARAAKEAGGRTISDIVERYESKTFGFASQNFYASYLGALHVAKNSHFYLGEIPRARQLEFDEFVMPHYMSLKVFLDQIGILEEDFHELNPALTKEVFSGRKYIPVGYTVRVPVEVRGEFLSKYEKIPASEKHSAQKADEAAAEALARAPQITAQPGAPLPPAPAPLFKESGTTAKVE